MERSEGDSANAWSGKLIVVTGGCGAIGSAVCRYALEYHHMIVAIVDLDATVVERTVAALRGNHPESQVHGFASDVSNLHEQRQLVHRVEDATGMIPSIVLLCAGINRSEPLLRASPTAMQQTMGVNFWGIYNGVRAFLPIMESQGGSPRSRHIVSVASMAGICQCMGTYGVSKHAVVGLSESFELELTQRRSVVSMACMVPGWIKTADPHSLGNMPALRVAEVLFDGIAKGRFLMTTHPDLLPVSLRGRLDYLIPCHPASRALGDAPVDEKLTALKHSAQTEWSYDKLTPRPSDVLHVALADTAKSFSSEILGSFATEYVDNQRLLHRIAAIKEATAELQQSAKDGLQFPETTLGAIASSKNQPKNNIYQLFCSDSDGKSMASNGLSLDNGMQPGDLRGKCALVTGGSSGIGKSVALALSALGCQIHIVGRSAARLQQVAELCRKAGAPEVCCHQADLCNAEEVEKLCAVCGQAVDILVNCAGMAHLGSCLQGNLASSANDWGQLMQLNLLTPMLLSRRIAPGMKKKGKGFIINIGSESGTTTRSMVPVYAASKHGLRGWSYNCHNELLVHGIRVVCVNPDWVNTPMVSKIPGLNLKKILQCEDLNRIVLNILRLPKESPLADVSIILKDKAAAWHK